MKARTRQASVVLGILLPTMASNTRKPTSEYFEDLRFRLRDAEPLQPWPKARPRPASFNGWHPQPTTCHANVDRFCLHVPRYRGVRGWLVVNEQMLIAHSALFDSCTRELLDITPVDQIDRTAAPRYSELRFVRHRGSEAEFLLIAQRQPQYLYAIRSSA